MIPGPRFTAQPQPTTHGGRPPDTAGWLRANCSENLPWTSRWVSWTSRTPRGPADQQFWWSTRGWRWANAGPTTCPSSSASRARRSLRTRCTARELLPANDARGRLSGHGEVRGRGRAVRGGVLVDRERGFHRGAAGPGDTTAGCEWTADTLPTLFDKINTACCPIGQDCEHGPPATCSAECRGGSPGIVLGAWHDSVCQRVMQDIT